MENNKLQALVETTATVERDGILVTKEIASRTVWDKLAVENPTHAVISAENEQAAAKKSAPQIEHLIQHVRSGDILLDLGAGYGRVAKYVLPQMVLGGYVAVDSAYEMLSLFKQRYESEEAERRTPALFVNADINALPLKDASVDVIIVSAVFLHNHKSVVKQSMAEVTRVLRPGGTVLVYASFPRSATAMGLQGAVYQGFLTVSKKPFKNGPVRYYSRREVAELFSGFAELDIVPVGFTCIPKSLIFLPTALDKVWRVGFANPLNTLLEKITPTSCKHCFAVHYDVVAKR